MKNNFKYIIILLLFAVVAFFIGGCSSTNDEPITIQGSTTMVPLLQQLAIAYGQNQEAPVDIEATGSIKGLKALINKETHIACSSVPVSDEIIAQALKNNVHIKAFPVCRDKIIAIVNTTNSVDKLSKSQLKELFTGRVSNWSSLGGQNAPVNIILRKKSSGTHQVWADKVLNGIPFIATNDMTGSNSGVLAKVAENENAIGYISAAYLNNEVKQVRLTESEKDSPIDRTLFLYVDKNNFTKNIKAFISFLYSEPAKIIITNNGFVPDAQVKPPVTNL
jgi:phosphate transport system substrate-binding protein